MPRPPLNFSAGHDDEPRAQWLTRAALVLGLAIAIARATMLETLRDPFGVSLGSQPVPRGAGAASGVVLDVLAWLPLLLILTRRLVDRGFRLRGGWSILPLGLLAIWSVVSTAWASDKFLALVGALHFASAVVLFLAMAQVVTTWARLRLVAGIAFGLLLVFIAHGLYYRLVDLPDLQRSFEQNKAQILQERGWEPGSFAAEQFAKKITGGEMIGFSASPNTFAAAIVLVALVTAGMIVQRLRDRDSAGWAVPYAIGIGLGAVIVWFTHGKAAMVAMTLGIAGVALPVAIPRLREWYAGRSAAAYWLGVAAVVLGVAAVVGHGTFHHGLPTDSLNFRWRYWVGSARLFERHPLVGVGWNNFGPHYLGVREQASAEEIKDPHNFLFKFLLELGVVGWVLAVAWLLRLAWETTRPALRGADEEESPAGSPVGKVALIAGIGVALNVLASLDLGEQIAYVIVELFKIGLYFCVLLIGGSMVTLRRVDPAERDRRAAGWVLYATLLALGLFLVQSLIDVAMFETGTMFLWFTLAGAAMGMKATEERGTGRTFAAAALAGTGAAWLAAIFLIVGPVVIGESLAVGADQAMRDRRPDRAATEYERAARAIPWNADYVLRAAKAAATASDNERALRLVNEAIAKDPMNVDGYLVRAGLELVRQPPDVAGARRDYEKALELNPADVGLRVTYADLLVRLGLKAEAREQYRIALDRNERYDVTEPKRLSPAEIERIRKAME